MNPSVDAAGSYLIQEKPKPLIELLPRLWRRLKWKLWLVWRDLRWEWKKARTVRSMPYHALYTPGDPVLNRLGQMDGRAAHEEWGVDVTLDGVDFDLSMDEKGDFYTKSMITSGMFIPKGRLRRAVEVSEFQADRLIQQLEIVAMDSADGLDRNEKILLDELRRVKAMSYADHVETDLQAQ